MATVRDVMSPDCQCIAEGASISEAAKKLAELNVGSMPICGDDDRLKGMITDRDIVVKVVAQGRSPEDTKAADLAEGTPIWIEADASIDDAASKMSEHQIRRLPVIEDKRLVGIVAQADVAQQGQDQKTGQMVEGISA